MKKFLAVVIALAMLLSLAACAGKPGNNDTTEPQGTETAADSLAVCLASEPDTLDPALNSAVDGATMLAHLFQGLAKWVQNDAGGFDIVADAATELVEGVANEDGTVTYTYTLKDGVKWSDGKDVTAADYVFSWNRAASAALGADYGYMFEVVKGYDEVSAADDDGNPIYPDAKLAVEAVDEKTISITLYNDVSYWNELLAFPVYFPVREDIVSSEDWAVNPETYVCNGPYTITAWEHNSVITLTKNENFVDAAEITMPEIKCYLSDDANNMLTNFKNGAWQLIDDVPVNEIKALTAEYPDEFKIAGQIGTYYVCWNINEDLLPEGNTLEGAEAEAAKAEIRKAIGLLLDRNNICDNISQAGEVPASSFVAMGMTNPDGTEFYKTAGHNDGYVGYYKIDADSIEENYNSAVETLKKYYDYDEATGKFTNFPTLNYIYNTNDNHKAIAEYIQSAFAGVGITMNLENQEWATFLNTRKNGDYSVARNGWVADYNDPICFLDMWTTISGNNDIQFGKGAHADVAVYSLDLTEYGYADIVVENGTWAETYDVLISTIKGCTDTEVRYQLMHLAEDILMDTGCVTPIYYYTDLYMISSKVSGFFSNPLGYKYFMYTTIG